MNDFAAVLMNNTTQSLSYNMNGQGTVNKSGKDAGDADFSSVLKEANLKASQATRGSKKDNTKTSEEMAAYAASSTQTGNRQPVADKADNTIENVSGVSNQTTTVGDTQSSETQTLNTQEAATEVAQILDVDEDQLSALLQLLDVELPVAMSSDDLPNFLVKLLTMMDEHLGAVAEAALPESQTSTAQLIETLLGNGQAANETGKVTTPITIDTADAPVVDVNVTVVREEAVMATPDVKAADIEIEPGFTLPIVTDDGTEVNLQQARDRLAAYVVKDNLPAEDAPVEEDAAPVTAADMMVTDADTDDIAVKQASENTSGENAGEQESESNQSTAQTDSAYMSKVPVSTVQPAQVAGVADVEVQPQVQVNTQDIINQIVEAARMTTADGTSQLEIQLHPQHLGKVGIVLTATEDGVTAQIKTPNDTVNQLLNAGMSDLMNSLKELGINMKNINVSQSELGWDFARGQAGQQMPQQQQGEHRQQSNSGHRNQVIRLADPQLSRLSNMLYGTSALQPMMGADASVDFQA